VRVGEGPLEVKYLVPTPFDYISTDLDYKLTGQRLKIVEAV